MNDYSLMTRICDSNSYTCISRENKYPFISITLYNHWITDQQLIPVRFSYHTMAHKYKFMIIGAVSNSQHCYRHLQWTTENSYYCWTILQSKNCNRKRLKERIKAMKLRCILHWTLANSSQLLRRNTLAISLNVGSPDIQMHILVLHTND